MVLTSWHLLKTQQQSGMEDIFLDFTPMFRHNKYAACTGPCYHCAARLSVARTARRPAASWRLGAAAVSWPPYCGDCWLSSVSSVRSGHMELPCS